MKSNYLIILLFLLSCQNKNGENKNSDASIANEIAHKVVPSFEFDDKANLSTLAFPLDFPVNDLSKMVNKVLPDVLLNDTLSLNKKGDLLKIRIEPIGKMLFNAYGNNLDASLPMKVEVQIEKTVFGVRLKNDTPIEFQLRTDLHTKLSIGSDWNLSAECQIQKIQWINPPQAKVFGITIDLERQLNGILERNYGKIEDVVCEMISEMVPIKQQVIKLWEILNEPHQVAKTPVDIWLSTRPELFAANFDASITDTIRVNVITKTHVVVSPLAGIVTEKASIPANSAVGTIAPNLGLKVKLHVPYEHINLILQDQLGEKIFTYQGYTIQLENFTSETLNDKLHFSFDLTGDLIAKVHAYTVPTLSLMKNLEFQEVEYKIESKNSIVNMASWFADATIKEAIQNQSIIPLSDFIDSMDDRIVEALNQSNIGSKIELKLNFSQFEEDTIVFYDDMFEWMIDVNGRANFYLTSDLVR